MKENPVMNNFMCEVLTALLLQSEECFPQQSETSYLAAELHGLVEAAMRLTPRSVDKVNESRLRLEYRALVRCGHSKNTLN